MLANPAPATVGINSPLTTFGEIKTADAYPRVQIDGVYGLVGTDYETFTETSGAATSNGSLLTCTTGTTAGAYGVIRSRRFLRYRAGESSRFQFTALFTPGVASSVQLAGAFTATEALWFGYNGATFGLGRRVAGACAIYRLTVTAGSGGAETVTVTLNGVGFTVAVGGATTTLTAAQAIAARVGGYTGWAFVVSNDATVTFLQRVAGPTPGAFTLSSTGTIAGTFAQLQAGVANDLDTGFVALTAWNVDKLDGSGPSGMTIDPTKLNVYEIDLSYLGAGAIPFYVMTPAGKLALVHVIQYPNSAVVPHMKDPSLRLGWVAASLGSTTNLTVSGASAAGFIQGPVVSLRDPIGFSTSFTATTSENAWLLFRNRVEYANRVNHREMLPVTVGITNETAARIARARFVINPTLSSTVNWQYVNQADSSVEYALGSGITVTGGRQVGAFAAATQQSLDLRDTNLRLEPGDVLAICVSTATATAVVDASLNWQEE